VQVLGSRRGGVAVAVLATAALLALGAFTLSQFLGRAAIASADPGPGGAVATTTPLLTVRIANAGRLESLVVLVDGRDVTEKARGAGDRLVVAPGRLREGAHTAEVSFRTSNLFARTVRRRWTFHVDVTRPALAIHTPARRAVSRSRRVRLSGTAEPGARITATWRGGAAQAQARADGRWAARATFPEGAATVKVAATDRAGNSTVRRREVLVDTVAPVLRIGAPASGSLLTETDRPLIRGSIPNDNPARLTFGAIVNGRSAGTVPGRAAASAELAAQDGEPDLTIDGHTFSLAVGTLAQGDNRVTVWVRDPAGNVAKRTLTLLVDSTEQFGRSELRPGARGDDVTALQERLATAGVFTRRPTGRFDAATAAAVRRYQRRHGLSVTGTVGPRTLRALVGRIVVNLSQFKLRLIRDGKVVKTYPVAVGQAAYPTPTGDWSIVNLQKNPTWIPPDSPWAKGLGPIPPGPGNPLGTRWIGTSAPAVGIHGTYADSTIGTRASHGCIRMRIPDVEELYDQVTVGMPVIIRP